MSSNPNIAFIDLKAQQERIRPLLDKALTRVLDHGQYIMGPEIGELEEKLAAFTGAKHCIACSSGTDSIILCLMAKGLEPGDVVFVPTFTFVATAEAPALVGAVPFFVDVLPDTFNMDPASLKDAIVEARKMGLTPKGVIAVDLFGQPAEYNEISTIAEQEDLFLIGDAAQSLGASYGNRKVGSLCELTPTSFFPAKPLGCYGDGGAVFTDDDDLADLMRSLLVHGKGTDKYDNVRIGLNARFDTIQAAVMIEKLAIFPSEVDARDKVAARYGELLSGMAGVPVVAEGSTSVWAQYTVKLPKGVDRDSVQAALSAKGVPSAIYYPIPLHAQTGYLSYPKISNGLPVSEDLSARVISLPMHPYLETNQQDYIVSALKSALKDQQ